MPRKRLLSPLLPLSSVLAFGLGASAQDQPTNQIHYPIHEELAGVLQAADAAREAEKWDEAVELYRSVLDTDCPAGANVGYQIARWPQPAGAAQPATSPGRRFKGITTWAIEGLRALPRPAVQIFRRRFDYRAAALRDRALASSDPYQQLARAYELYPIATCAPSMLETMGELALERGDLARAQRAFSSLLTWHGHELESPPRVRQKLLVCALGLGLTDQVRELARELVKDDPSGAVHLTGAPVDVQELIKRAHEAAQRRREALAGRVPLVRVDAMNRARVDVAASFGGLRFPPKSFDRSEVEFGGGGRTFVPGGSAAPARHLPLVDLREGAATGFVVTADQILAYDLLTGEERPRIPRLSTVQHQEQNAKLQFGGALERGLLVAPQLEEVLKDQSFRGIPIKVKIPVRKLAAFDVGSWRWQWNHARSLDGTPQEGWSWPCPPVADEGVVFASAFGIQGFVNCYATAFDVRTGDPLWSTWVASGQVEQTMFGEHATEPLAVPVAVDQGVVYHVTCFGCLAALDADTGRLLWVAEYDQIEVRAPKGYYADPRTISWENNAPLVESGVVVAAPLDSDHYYGFDARTGEMLWRYRRRQFAVDADMRYLIGAADGRTVLGGGHEVRCLDVHSGKTVWRAPLRGKAVAGRGVICRDQVCVPVDDEVLLFELSSGKRTQRFTLAASGNLVVAGEHAVITGSDGRLAVHVNRPGEGKALGDK